MDRIVHGVAKSWTRLSDFHFLLFSIISQPNVLKTPVILDSSFSHLQSGPSTYFFLCIITGNSFVHICFISTALCIASLLTSLPLFTYVNSFMRSPKLSPSIFDYIFPIKWNANYHHITKLFKTDFITFLFYILHYPAKSWTWLSNWIPPPIYCYNPKPQMTLCFKSLYNS